MRSRAKVVVLILTGGMVIGALALNSIQKPAEVAYSTSSVRI